MYRGWVPAAAAQDLSLTCAHLLHFSLLTFIPLPVISQLFYQLKPWGTKYLFLVDAVSRQELQLFSRVRMISWRPQSVRGLKTKRQDLFKADLSRGIALLTDMDQWTRRTWVGVRTVWKMLFQGLCAKLSKATDPDWRYNQEVKELFKSWSARWWSLCQRSLMLSAANQEMTAWSNPEGLCSIQIGQGVLAIESQGAISKARTAGRRDFTHYRSTSVPYMNLYHVGYDCIWSSVNNWEHINSSATWSRIWLCLTWSVHS